MPALGGFLALRSRLISRADDSSDDEDKKDKSKKPKKKSHENVDPGGQTPGGEPTAQPVPAANPATGLESPSATAQITEPIQLTVIEVLPTATVSTVVQVGARPTTSSLASESQTTGINEPASPDVSAFGGVLGLPSNSAGDSIPHPSVVICEPGMSLCATTLPTAKGSAKTADDNRSGATSSPNMTAPIVGSVLGALVIVLAITVGVIFCIRRRRKTHVAPSAQYMSSKASDAASFRRLPSDYSSSRSNSSLGMRDPAESLRGGSPVAQSSQLYGNRY